MYQIVVFLLGHLHFFLHFSSRSWRTFLRNPLYHIGVFAVFFWKTSYGRTDGGTDGGSDGWRYQRMEAPMDGWIG